MKENIEILEELTKNLQFKELIISHKNDFFEVKGDGGSVLAQTLYRDNKISIAKSFAKKGVILSAHSHKGKEWFGVITGKVKLVFDDGNEYVLKEGEGFEINDERKHSCVYLEDSWLWLVSYPPEFPLN